ncbi:MAG: 2-oxoacid:acceptor oxidoreductase subunit alpha [Planctomycetes bacterium]|nr:2-oxoacid:acceptor oxidoreductase subunit alpha [Planctomycetota bacterium]
MSQSDSAVRPNRKVETLDQVVIRFAGDSGDGMQLTGSQFTNTAALMGNDLATLPDFPAEIRAPAGTLAGVSGFQLRFSSYDIHTPGDAPDVLVAMNAAALKVNLGDLRAGGLLIVNTGGFGKKELEMAGYPKSPLEGDALRAYRVVAVDLNDLTKRALEGLGLSMKEALRCKNFFALGVCCWLFSRPLDPTEAWIKTKFAKSEQMVEANLRVLRAGFNFADTTELFQTVYQVPPAAMPKGTYRNVMGNEALSMGFLAASELSGLELFLGSYPITPASDILHTLAAYKNFGVTTFQAEDEIAAITSAIGASYAGKIGMTTTSGPGVALKTEALGLAVSLELPLVLVNVQRGGPSTGLPTKTEQADLFQAVLGRNGEAPIPVIAAASPADCFYAAIEAVRLAIRYMTPVILLSDGYIANGSEPWLLPKVADLPKMPVRFAGQNGEPVPEKFLPYLRDEKTLARPWAVPGTPGYEHRIGGIEKADKTGSISYDPENHERMCKLRQEKVNRIASDCPPPEFEGDEDADIVVLGWGSTHGAITGAVRQARANGLSVARCHLRHVWPFPQGLGPILKRAKKVLIPEMNLGQLWRLVRSEYLVDAISLPKVQGRPFTSSEILEKIQSLS